MCLAIPMKITTIDGFNCTCQARGIAAGLLIAAFAGKLVSGLGARPPSDKWVIGVGMLPRGEVGLVFATIGRTLGVIDDAILAAIVAMIFVSTLVAPPLLKVAISRQPQRLAPD
jgi:Kef-type K+ transport system membrane component KefB